MAAAIESSVDWVVRWDSLDRRRGSAVAVGGRWGSRRPVSGLVAPPRVEKGTESTMTARPGTENAAPAAFEILAALRGEEEPRAGLRKIQWRERVFIGQT
jgi:hypothetical protein